VKRPKQPSARGVKAAQSVRRNSSARAPTLLERVRQEFAAGPKEYVDRKLYELHQQFLKGDRASLPMAIRWCADSGRPLHGWVVIAWAMACNAVINRDVMSWDDVLMNPEEVPARTQRQKDHHARERQTHQQLGMLLSALQVMRDVPIDETFFATLANFMSVTPQRAQYLYYHRLPAAMRLPEKRARSKPGRRK
jgi:hypothetical protein